MNNIGILYNAFVCFITGITSTGVFYSLSRKRRGKTLPYSRGLDYFCLFLGLIWILIGIRALFTWFGLEAANIFIYEWFIGPLTYLHLLPAFFYFSWSFFGNEKTKGLIFKGIFIAIAAAAICAFYLYGFSPTELTYWGNNIVPNKIANTIFNIGIFLPGLIFIVSEIIRRYRNFKKTGEHLEKQLLGFALGFLIYAVVGIFEALIFTQGWKILLIRTLMMLAPITFYFFSTLNGE